RRRALLPRGLLPLRHRRLLPPRRARPSLPLAAPAPSRARAARPSAAPRRGVQERLEGEQPLPQCLEGRLEAALALAVVQEAPQPVLDAVLRVAHDPLH